MILTSTGAAKAVASCFGTERQAHGIPCACHAERLLVDLKFIAKKATTVEEVNMPSRAAESGPSAGILGVTEVPNVSVDFIHDPRSIPPRRPR